MYDENLQQSPTNIDRINLKPYMFFISSFNILEKNLSLILSQFSNSFEMKTIDDQIIEFCIIINDEKILIKNGLKFTGLSYTEATNLEIFFYKCGLIINILNNNNINYKFVSSPSSFATHLMLKHTNSIVISKIQLQLPIYSSTQFCSKYFLLLKKYYKLSISSEMYSLYGELIKYEYTPSVQELTYFKREKKMYNIDLPKNLNKLIKNKEYFELCQHYLNSNKIFFTQGEDFILKPAFFGGRIEILTNIEYTDESKKVIEVDMPSAYYSTLRNVFPVGNVIVEENPTQYKIKECEFYECEVSYFSTNLPVLPLKVKDGVIFPAGNFKGTWMGCELLLFIEQGGIIKKIKKRFF
jgi:hypothetical protein